MYWIAWIILPLTGLTLGWIIRWLYARFQLKAAEQLARQIREDAVKNADAIRKEMLLEAKEKIISERNHAERETRERRTELQRLENRILQREDVIEKKMRQAERVEHQLAEKEKAFVSRENALLHEEERYRLELERISGLTSKEAKAQIIKHLEGEAQHDAQTIINKIESEAMITAEKKAQDILVTAIQRLATDVTGEITVATVPLPDDEMKGRIIGREGRNIRTLETVTGVDIIIDDTPEAAVISCFDPVRREIAKIALDRLITDGRIHPARIEEVVSKVSRDISQKIFEEGEKLIYDLGIHNISQDAIRLLGRLYFRTSYGQNVLKHSREVAQLSSLLAAELGANRELAKRAAALHDIGKGVETDSDLNHAEIGMEMARKMGEDSRVINAIGAHHGDIEPACLESVIVQIADAISAARPGARKETLDNYIKRLKNLENIASGFSGVEKAFAIQAGRELRVVVHNDQVSDEQSRLMARDVAKKIEDDLHYPGRIKVTVIRETRIVEYAR
ncbi:MAG: ribonuclease Y [Spirochaetaceae bacterium]|jgi:ribonuclease Y|nr:ribonuclease Y [Spirochaetaceae bacterium]